MPCQNQHRCARNQARSSTARSTAQIVGADERVPNAHHKSLALVWFGINKEIVSGRCGEIHERGGHRAMLPRDCLALLRSVSLAATFPFLGFSSLMHNELCVSCLNCASGGQMSERKWQHLRTLFGSFLRRGCFLLRFLGVAAASLSCRRPQTQISSAMGHTIIKAFVILH